MEPTDFPQAFLDFLATITGKRARIVVDHILQHGFITTEELENQYGYKHPPRAVRDVREQGVPIETFSVKNSQGRVIAAYRFGDPTQIGRRKVGGRLTFPRAFKTELYSIQEGRCAICQEHYDERYLQIDHRVPYEVSGNSDDITNTAAYMLICGSCNRAKSWSCEHCENWRSAQNPNVCWNCYWGSPTAYEHIALRPTRRLDLVWSGDDVTDYERLKTLAEDTEQKLPDFVKQVLRRYLRSKLP